MKRNIRLLIVLILISTLFAGCSSSKNRNSDKISIVSTIFPAYDWTQNVLGDNTADINVSMLLDKGVDMHNYQPSADDIIKISSCDLFIYVGGESDEWVDDVLKTAGNKDMIVLNLLEILEDSLVEEELKEGMENDSDPQEASVASEEIEYDEHVWLSLTKAATAVNAIKDAIIKIDSGNAEKYERNCSEYVKKLNSLDERYAQAISEAKCKTILFGDRFPFRYLTSDYNLDYYAAFAGCSAESEASFETILFLSKKLDELGLSAVITLEGSSKQLAETIVSNTQNKNARILTMNSMQSITGKDVKNGISYLSIMEENLLTLKEALK